MMRPDTEEHRSAVRSALRSAGHALTTWEVCQAVGPILCHWVHEEWVHDVLRGVRLVSCDGTYCVVIASLGSRQRGWQILSGLRIRGEVRSIRHPARQSLTWVLTGGRVDQELLDLEAAFALDAATR